MAINNNTHGSVDSSACYNTCWRTTHKQRNKATTQTQHQQPDRRRAHTHTTNAKQKDRHTNNQTPVIQTKRSTEEDEEYPVTAHRQVRRNKPTNTHEHKWTRAVGWLQWLWWWWWLCCGCGYRSYDGARMLGTDECTGGWLVVHLRAQHTRGHNTRTKHAWTQHMHNTHVNTTHTHVNSTTRAAGQHNLT